MSLTADRLIPRVDAKGQAVVFLADTLKEDSITMWRSNSEPMSVELKYYHATKPLEAKETDKLTREYTRTYGHEVEVMQRLPRVIGDAPRLKRLKSPQVEVYVPQEPKLTQPEPIDALTDVVMADQHPVVDGRTNEAPATPLQSYVMRKYGSLWKVLDASGCSVAYAADESDALSVLNDLLGEGAKLMH